MGKGSWVIWYLCWYWGHRVEVFSVDVSSVTPKFAMCIIASAGFNYNDFNIINDMISVLKATG